ncbi:MAG: CBS domain-containing protein, partial [Candidatus Thermoplasmatota archaeon]|nr:CBS domain-containing protein [Candidatus Thermoplasmatota archaeon]
SNGRIVGIISLKDAKRVPIEETSRKRVRDVMRTKFAVLEPDQDAGTAWKKMLSEGLGRFPVLENDRLIGIVTRSDIDRMFNIQSELGNYKV